MSVKRHASGWRAYELIPFQEAMAALDQSERKVVWKAIGELLSDPENPQLPHSRAKRRDGWPWPRTRVHVSPTLILSYTAVREAPPVYYLTMQLENVMKIVEGQP